MGAKFWQRRPWVIWTSGIFDTGHRTLSWTPVTRHFEHPSNVDDVSEYPVGDAMVIGRRAYCPNSARHHQKGVVVVDAIDYASH